MNLRHAAAALVLALLALSSARGEEGDETGQRTMPFAVRDTSAARYAVRETRRLLATDRTTQGLRLAQEVLDELPHDFYRLPGPDASIRWRLAAEEVRDLLAGLGRDERAIYDRLVSPATQPMVADALARRDATLLGAVVDRYGASGPGVDAARLLADLALEEGRGRDAASWARRGLRFAAGDAGLWVRLIDALAAAHDGAALAALDLPEQAARLEAGPGRTLAAHLEAWRARLPPPASPGGSPMWGGGATRSLLAPAVGPRPDSLRWKRPIPFPSSVLDREPFRGGLRNREQHFLDAWERFCPFQPAVEGRVVYVADGRAVRALDLYSGTPLWTFDWEYPTPLELLNPRVPGQGRTSLERAFSPVLHDDLVLATVEVRQPYERETLQTVEISTYLPRRVLVALDRSDGSLHWHAGMYAGDAAILGDTTVVAPCVVSEDLAVVVLAQNEGGFHRVSLAAYDVSTGRLVWHRAVGWGNQELNLFGASVKELSASAPAVADGTVYASTGLGFVAAVDLRTGRPRWLASYDILPIEPVQVWYEAPLRFPRVAPSPAVVAGDLVLVAPTDGLHLHAFDRRTGQLRWRAAYPARARVGAPAHFLGVAHDGKRDVALVTGTDLVAYDITDGERVWVGRLQDEFGTQNVSIGRGAVSQGHALVPTSNGLVRFSLHREGSFEGRDPWPTHVRPGNLLPLPRLLLVAERDSLQAFYSWDEIERDIDRRRQARPSDPTVLLEAGEIYRMGGALDRAKRAFQEALDVARTGDGDAEAERKAAQGLYRTWRSVAAGLEEISPEQARQALERALEWARTPQERVNARLDLDRLLGALPNERAANLEGLVDESAGVRAAFPGQEGDEEVPARAMALLKLAQVRAEQGQPARAIEALQRLLAEEGDAEIGGESAHDLARAYVDEITRVWGREPYRPHEDAARHLLAQAEAEDGADLLDRILREYPNASVVPAALLRLGERRLGQGEARVAADILRRLLSEYAGEAGAPKAAALLARAYGVQGLSGARAFALAWLGETHPEARFEIEGQDVEGAAWAAAQARDARFPLPPHAKEIRTPLREVHFESVGDEAWGRQVGVSTSHGGPAPVALLTDGRVIVAFDLVHAKVAFRLDIGPCHRAFYDEGVLVLASSRALTGVTVDTGQTLWSLPVEGSTLDLQGIHGQVYALLHDTAGQRGDRNVVAVDIVRGKVIWRLPLGGHADFRDLRVKGSDLLLREARYQAGRVWPAMLVVDGLAGRLRHVVGLPAEGRTEGDPIIVADRLVVAARDTSGRRHVSAHDLATGELAWTRPLPGRARVCALHGDAAGVVVLQADGVLGTYRIRDGFPAHLTKIFVGDGADACPLHGTVVVPAADRLVLMPRIAKPPVHVGAWDRENGKLLWLTPWDEERSPSRSTLLDAGDAVLALTPFTPPRAPARVLLRVLSLEDGAVRQEIEPMGLTAEFGLLSMARGWGTVVVFGRAGAVIYAGAER